MWNILPEARACSTKENHNRTAAKRIKTLDSTRRMGTEALSDLAKMVVSVV